MMGQLTYIALAITVMITGYYAVIFIRDPEVALERATHRRELLPLVMTGRYIALFLFALGVMLLNDIKLSAFFFSVCAFIGLYDGWIYRSRNLPHFKHTITGLLALGALGISILALVTSGTAI
ncbi:hypothetical protein [Phaeobacter sp. 22II1-1F12B]|uniref:hypothetical protein n=1 Tax=Phaeobacter sp. 22II1-1F12B TaxID=1317111 RepID=UPI000B527FF5|nr:hypothetical protein [Phaeobacter sp. 22II1-1F12B]OWU75214.1 hypothetical protein ATO1_18680 [Phaeobacter sp. 22II1-1F12B]